MGITTVRPTATDAISSAVSVAPSGTAHAATDDAPADDSSYITSYAWGHYVFLGLGDLTLTATQRIKQVRGHIRCFHNSADVGHQDLVDFRLRDMTTLKETKATTLGTYSNSAVDLYTGWYTAAPGGGAWSETIFDRMDASIAWRARVTTPPNTTQLRVSEVYVDADIHEQPAVSAVTVTGFNTSTTPSYSFTYTDADATDPQVRHRAKVFSAAQFGVSGFNAETSPNTWDSGEVAGSQTGGTVGKKLIDGVTYRVYVKAAKAWVGPAGTLWYSTWVASSNFTVSTTPPATPSLSVVAFRDTPPWLRNVITVDAPMNLLDVNPSTFEGTIGSSGWVNDTNATLTVSATNPAQGTQSLQMSSVAAGTMIARHVSSPANGIPVRPTRQYTAQCQIRTAVSARTVNILIRWYRADGSTLISTSTSSNVTDSTTYQTISVTANAPNQAAFAVLAVQVVSTAGAAEIHRVDLVDFHFGSSTTYTVAGFSTTQTVTVERGERVDNQRGPALNWIHPQVGNGGTPEQTALVGFRRAAGNTDDLLRWSPLTAAMDGPGGQVVWTPRAGNTDQFCVGGAEGVTDESEWWMPVVASQSHVGSLWLSASGAFTAAINIEWLDDGGSVVGTTSGSTTVLGATPVRVSTSGSAPSNAVFARMRITNPNSTVGVDVNITKGGWGLGTVPVDDQRPAGGPLVWTEIRDFSDLTNEVEVGSRVVISDVEMPTNRPVLYRARTVAGTDPNFIASAYSTSATTRLASVARTVLQDPFRADLAVLASVRLESDGMANAEDVTELHGMGRDIDPVFIRAWRGRTRSFELTVLSENDYAELMDLLESSRSLLFQWTDGGQTYVRVTRISPTRVLRGRYKVSIDTAETARPAA